MDDAALGGPFWSDRTGDGCVLRVGDPGRDLGRRSQLVCRWPCRYCRNYRWRAVGAQAPGPPSK